ncbi:MAG TPA: CatB-related O-acetyltransferase [Clostridia bacterium]|nr:CatB-related O-acetyltransferase [Clostridia bacterium]
MKQTNRYISCGNNINIKDHTYGVPKIVRRYATDLLEIGSYCSIASNVTLHYHHNHEFRISLYPFFADPEYKEGPTYKHEAQHIIIGNDVWIGASVNILADVTIGDGAVIGTGAVITKDIPPYAIAVGNPPQIKGYRYDEETIQKLLKIAWWNWPQKTIRKYLPIIQGHDIDRFINKFYKEN